MEQFLSAKFLSGRNANQKIGILDSTENQKVLEVIGRVGIGTTVFDPNYQLDVRGDVFIRDALTVDSITVTGAGNSFSGITTFTDTTDNVLGNADTGAVQIDGGLGVNKNTTVGAALSVGETAYIVGVSTFKDRVIFDSTNSIQIPVGTTAERDIVGVAVTGQIRYNTQLSSFEGYGPGGEWGSLGGVKDVDQDTYIIPETSAGSDEDTLYFYTGGNLSGTLSSTTGADLNVNLNVDGHIETDTLNVSGLSTFASDVDVNASVDISTSLTVGSATTITGSGIIAGIVTGTLDNDLTLATSGTGLSGSATYNNSGATTFTVTSNATDANTPGTIVARDVSGNFSAGTITADLTGNVTGDLTGVASTATQLETARDFSITGSFVTAPAISFDGTANVALAATITPDSITLGTYTSGDYVESITGTSNQITVTGGTGESSTPTLSVPNQFTTPQDATVTRDLNVLRDLNVTGNITVGGTSATIFTTQLQVEDADIILGVRTDGLGNDVSTDNTANHGGIAIASTEGNPLVDLYVAGIETVPTTYKKIMWFKAGTFAGLGTDAWLSNYAVGIGSTQFPTGTRLAAGNVQITEDDISVVRNIDATGIITANSFNGNGANLTSLNASNLSSGTVPGARGVTAGSSDTSFVTYNGTTKTAGQFDGGTTAPSNTTRLNYDGWLYATQFNGSGAGLSNIPLSGVSGAISGSQINTVTGSTTYYISATDSTSGLSSDSYVKSDIVMTGLGSVGIGSATPIHDLDLIGDAKLAGKIYSSTNSEGGLSQVLTSGGPGGDWTWQNVTSIGAIGSVNINDTQSSDNYNLTASIVGSSSTATLYKDTDIVLSGLGSLGIGTDSPTTKLDVNGDLRLRGDLYDVGFSAGTDGQLLVSRGTGLGVTWADGAAIEFGVSEMTASDTYYISALTGIGNTTVNYIETTNPIVMSGIGSVGINSATPQNRLDVIGDVKLAGEIRDVNNSAGTANYVLASGGPGGNWTWKVVTDVGAGILDAVNIKQDGTNVGTGTATEFDFYENFLITQPSAGIASIRLANGINISGIVTATDFNSTSDARLKTNVQVIEDPLEKVLQINGVSFNWIKDNKPSMGVIADNIQEVLPELVSDTDPKTVNYNGLIGLLIECVKQQQEEINILKESINNNK